LGKKAKRNKFRHTPLGVHHRNVEWEAGTRRRAIPKLRERGANPRHPKRGLCDGTFYGLPPKNGGRERSLTVGNQRPRPQHPPAVPPSCREASGKEKPHNATECALEARAKTSGVGTLHSRRLTFCGTQNTNPTRSRKAWWLEKAREPGKQKCRVVISLVEPSDPRPPRKSGVFPHGRHTFGASECATTSSPVTYP